MTTGPCPRQCPAPARFEPRTVGGVTVDVCSGCHGVWLDPGELEQLIGREPGEGNLVQRALKDMAEALKNTRFGG
ncbi:MAG: zf-TFIIB domain-containing protein [Gemmatimonadales bacterium]|nr:zf-TFIIB domain-containing protein [Gemmatimonadales bacterium]